VAVDDGCLVAGKAADFLQLLIRRRHLVQDIVGAFACDAQHVRESFADFRLPDKTTSPTVDDRTHSQHGVLRKLSRTASAYIGEVVVRKVVAVGF